MILKPCPDPDLYLLLYGEQFMSTDRQYFMRYEHHLPENAKHPARHEAERGVAVQGEGLDDLGQTSGNTSPSII